MGVDGKSHGEDGADGEEAEEFDAASRMVDCSHAQVVSPCAHEGQMRTAPGNSCGQVVVAGQGGEGQWGEEQVLLGGLLGA